MKLIAADTGVNFSKTNAAPDILDLRIFMQKLHAIPISHRSSPTVKLSEVDETVYKNNITYLANYGSRGEHMHFRATRTMSLCKQQQYNMFKNSATRKLSGINYSDPAVTWILILG
ncbi:hypothetical protein GCK32_021571 [Trichostrongylus colubriformis]|uniref:Uncharacterized protein n=1 Tax=Trichostrongylus colubriformis TaxID=6319 RepID=A0AAN8FFB1_TRICO